MTVIATASNPRFSVSRIEIDRPGPTYTKDTLIQLRDELTASRGAVPALFFITGADALAQILSWKDPEDALRVAHFIGVTRPGYELSNEHLPAAATTLIDVPAMAISSSACRARVRSEQPIWYLVPDGVVQYIAKHRLYLGSAALAADHPAEHPGDPVVVAG